MDITLKDIQADLNNISGATPEEKAEAHKGFAALREIWHWLYGRRGTALFIPVIAACVMYVLERLGVDTKHVGPFVTQILQHLMGT